MKPLYYNIIFSPKAYYKINSYISFYKEYFFGFYSDTGLQNEEEILNFYENESERRQEEIIDFIEEKLSNNIISYLKNETILKWRTKIILIKFQDFGEDRIITDLEIR